MLFYFLGLARQSRKQKDRNETCDVFFNSSQLVRPGIILTARFKLLIALSLTVGDDIVVLRTTDGPAWRGQGGGGICDGTGICTQVTN